MSDTAKRSVFVVVDPAQDRPLALERVLEMSSSDAKVKHQYSENTKLHIFLAVDSDNTDTAADNPAMHRSSTWFYEQIVTPLEQSGVDFGIELSWSNDWYGSIILRAQELQPLMIMLPLVSTPSERGRLFNESIWRLMRTAECPVYVARPKPTEDSKTMLAAINIQSHKPEYQELNDHIIYASRLIATNHNLDLQVVNAYSDSLNYPDRSQLASKTEVESGKIHVKSGDPEDVIADVAKEINADVVVIGTRKRASRWRGNTAERIITKVQCDILAIS